MCGVFVRIDCRFMSYPLAYRSKQIFNVPRVFVVRRRLSISKFSQSVLELSPTRLVFPLTNQSLSNACRRVCRLRSPGLAVLLIFSCIHSQHHQTPPLPKRYKRQLSAIVTQTRYSGFENIVHRNHLVSKTNPIPYGP